MKAQKVTITITVEVLAVEAATGLVNQALQRIDAEYEHGLLMANDGDTVRWETVRESIEF